MGNSTRLSFPVVSFRHLETPFQTSDDPEKPGCRDYFAVVDTRHLPDLTDWREINVRDPKLTTSVARAIRDSFRKNHETFLFMNRGIVLSVDAVSFSNKTSTVTLTLTDPDLHGLLDGGHTYNIITREKPGREQPQYVKLEILEGLDVATITDVVDARNTSTQVRDESLLNLANKFESLKEALRDTSYYKLISWSEYEENKPLHVRDIVGMLTAFDRDSFDGRVHPINAYRSKVACIQRFEDHIDSYEKLYPLAQDILALRDHIHEKLPDLYNSSGGKFGNLTGVKKYEEKGSRRVELYFTGRKSLYSIPEGFIYPILGGFRALLEERNGKYAWPERVDPVQLLQGELGKMLAYSVGQQALADRNPSKTGKSPLLWQSCYQAVRMSYLEP